MNYTYGDIDWEFDCVIEPDVDGSGTNLVGLFGWSECDEGSHLGHFEFYGTAMIEFPYEQSMKELDVTIESEWFVAAEKEDH